MTSLSDYVEKICPKILSLSFNPRNLVLSLSLLRDWERGCYPRTEGSPRTPEYEAAFPLLVGYTGN